jgi:hypothetical protein
MKKEILEKLEKSKLSDDEKNFWKSVEHMTDEQEDILEVVLDSLN